MVIFLLMGSYDRDSIEKIVMDSGYTKKPVEGFEGMKIYKYINEDGMIDINLTSSTDGKIQIQGEGASDVYYNKKKSKYFQEISELVKKN